jgi:hypothetical protein
MERFFSHFLQKPLIKTIISIFIPILIGIMTGFYTIKITTICGFDFKKSFKEIIFYILVILIILNCLYNYFVYKYEKNSSQFSNKNYCIAYMRSQLIPEMAETYKKKIKNGQITDLEDVMKSFERSLTG